MYPLSVRPEKAAYLGERGSKGSQWSQRQPPFQLMGTHMKTTLHICYRCVSDLGPACTSSLVVGSVSVSPLYKLFGCWFSLCEPTCAWVSCFCGSSGGVLDSSGSFNPSPYFCSLCLCVWLFLFICLFVCLFVCCGFGFSRQGFSV